MQVRDRRALLIGGAAIAIGSVVLRGVPGAVAAVSTLQDRVQAESALLQSVRQQIARREPLSDSLDLLRDVMSRVTGLLLEAGTEDEAAAELTSRITVALSRPPVRLDAVRPLRDSTVQVPAQVRAVAVFQADVRGLTSALRELEGDSRVTVRQIELAAANPSIGDAGAEVLRVEVEVKAFFVPGAGELPKPDSALITGGSI